MATHGDFYIVGFGEHLGDNVGDLDAPWATFKGNESSEKTFVVDGEPLNQYDKYLLMQVLNVHSFGHIVRINGVDLAGIDISQSPEPNMWNVVLDWIDAPIHRGENTIQIIRASGGDNFAIGNAFIHWRETSPIWLVRLLPKWFTGLSIWSFGRKAPSRLETAPLQIPARKPQQPVSGTDENRTTDA